MTRHKWGRWCQEDKPNNCNYVVFYRTCTRCGWVQVESYKSKTYYERPYRMNGTLIRPNCEEKP